jgi:ribosomal protein L16 Arg81 hydroxylase
MEKPALENPQLEQMLQTLWPLRNDKEAFRKKLKEFWSQDNGSIQSGNNETTS